MPISSLNNFSVPLGKDGNSANNQGLLMPKLPYRFRVRLVNFGLGADTTEMTKQVMNVGRPVVTFGDIKLHVYNSTVKLPGKPSWSDIELVLRDDASGQVSRKVAEQVQKQFDFFEQASASSGNTFKFTTNVEILDGGNGAYDPITLENFELTGCYIKVATYEGMDYSKDTEPVTVKLSISYDNATQLTGVNGLVSGIGIAVGRPEGFVATGG